MPDSASQSARPRRVGPAVKLVAEEEPVSNAAPGRRQSRRRNAEAGRGPSSSRRPVHRLRSPGRGPSGTDCGGKVELPEASRRSMARVVHRLVRQGVQRYTGPPTGAANAQEVLPLPRPCSCAAICPAVTSCWPAKAVVAARTGSAPAAAPGPGSSAAPAPPTASVVARRGLGSAPRSTVWPGTRLVDDRDLRRAGVHGPVVLAAAVHLELLVHLLVFQHQQRRERRHHVHRLAQLDDRRLVACRRPRPAGGRSPAWPRCAAGSRPSRPRPCTGTVRRNGWPSSVPVTVTDSRQLGCPARRGRWRTVPRPGPATLA